jgi:hypothetical protein
MPVILILIDAMRYDYISKNVTPFLYDCCQKGEYYTHVIPSYGFCERTEILSGLNPAESGYFTAIGYDPENSPYKTKPSYRIFDIIVNSLPNKIYNPISKRGYKVRQKFREIIKSNFIKNHNIPNSYSPYNIPFSFLPYFNLTEDAAELAPLDQTIKRSVLTLLDKSGKKYFSDAFTSLNMFKNISDESRFRITLKALKKKCYSFLMIYNSIPDHFGHVCGTDSNELKNSLSNLDNMIHEFVDSCLKIDNSTNFIFLGDHGMVNVEKKLDVRKMICLISKKEKLKELKDYIYFLDSTVLRIWFFNEHSKSIFEKGLKDCTQLNENGVFLTKEIAHNYKIPFGDKRYGDLVWLANSGVLIFPDFFHSSFENQGMHGYNPDDVNSHGTCIAFGENINPKKIDNIKLTEVYNILLDKLKL